MKHRIFLIVIMIISIRVDAQLKEEYDLQNFNLIYNRPSSNYDPCNIAPSSDQENFGDGMSYLVEGYITLYQTTQDKAYLYKFILESLCMIENRHDFAGISSEPRWSDLIYHDGNIVSGFARFVHYIKIENPSLYNEPLYQFGEFTTNSFGINFQTFGQYADWLQDRCGETLWWFILNGYWSDENAILDNPTPEASAVHINMQIGFGRALLFIGITTGEQDFLDKALIISQKFKGNISFDDLCNDQSYNHPLLRLNTDNSYWWYHNGWRIPIEPSCLIFDPFPVIFTNVPDIQLYTQYMEDISHGAQVTYLPYDFYLFQPNSDFSLEDMIRFRNMFAYHIYDGSFGFYESVLGSGQNTDPIGQLDFAGINYINFADFDGYPTAETGSTYDIIKSYYTNFWANSASLPPSYGGQANKGHAELVREQWERECVNLTLYNRDVVYDQDFFAKNILTIDPADGNGISYAEPTINTPEFIVNNNIQSTITAGEYISLKPGVQFKSGSYVSLKINPNLCSDGEIGGDNGNRTMISESTSSSDETSNMLPAFLIDLKIFPNPMQEKFQIEVKLSEESRVSISIFNITGNAVYQEIINQPFSAGGQTLSVDANNWPDGMYFCVLSTESGANAETKFIKTK